jgi:hypothetical protein
MDEWVTQAQTEQQKFVRRQSMRNPNFMRYQWTQPTAKRNGHRRHANDETVPMDVDPPTYTQVRRARTEADKDRFKLKGQCFYCERQGHMACDCPQKKKQFGGPDQSRFRSDQVRPGYGQPPAGSNQGFKKKFFRSPKPTQGFRKSNKPRQYTPCIRTATIEEAEEDEYQDNYEEEEEEEVQSLAVHTAKLSDDQKELWVSEMKDIGINFQ